MTDSGSPALPRAGGGGTGPPCTPLPHSQRRGGLRGPEVRGEGAGSMGGASPCSGPVAAGAVWVTGDRGQQGSGEGLGHGHQENTGELNVTVTGSFGSVPVQGPGGPSGGCGARRACVTGSGARLRGEGRGALSPVRQVPEAPERRGDKTGDCAAGKGRIDFVCLC